ncbi:hypothetical protein QKZ77_005367 [Salmonella enterica]|nr:hypothetical protein [Salmonella enterica]
MTVKTSGTDTAGQSGNITLNANITKTAGGDAALILAADGNITLSGKNITSANGKLDITLLGAGSNTGMVKADNSTLSSNGGNITVDQLNHTSTGTDGNTVTNPNAMTIKVSGSTLNATSSDSTVTSGDVVLRSYNPDVNLSQGVYNNTVRNGGAILQISDTSHLSGRDIIVEGTQTGNNAKSLPVFMNGATLTAERDITLRGVASNGATPAQLELRGAGNTLTATQGNITMENAAGCASLNGVFLNGSSAGKVQLTALNGTINLSGAAINSGKGVNVTNAVLNASKACITGNNGFSITSTTLEGALADLTNVSLSSAGSAAGVTNTLDSSIVTADNRDNLLAKKIENMTTMDMGGQAIFDDSTKTDKGWKQDYTSSDTPNGGWIFNNTMVNAGGDVNLKGASFTNSTINVTSGGLDITQDAGIELTGSTLNISGNVVLNSSTGLNLTRLTLNEQSVTGAHISLSSANNVTLTGLNVTTVGGSNQLQVNAGGNLTLTGSNVSAGSGLLDISLQAAGSATGMLRVENSILNSNGGNITLDQLERTTTGSDGNAVKNPNAMTSVVLNATLNATSSDSNSQPGNISISAYNPDVNLNQSIYKNTVRNSGGMLQVGGRSNLTAGNITLGTVSEGGNATGLPVFLNGVTMTAVNDITLSGTSLPVTTTSTADDGTVTSATKSPVMAPIELRGSGNSLTSSGGNITITNQAGTNNKGIYLNGESSGKVMLNAVNGNITLNGSSVNRSGVEVNNAVLNASHADIIGSSTGSGTGFSLTDTTLEGALADLTNVSLSSAGSAAGVTNTLDSSIVTADNRDNLLAKKIENMTTMDMGGQAIFDDSTKTDKGWKQDYTSSDTPNGGWIFNNTTVNAGGNVDVKGASFTNSTLTVTDGNLSLDNGGPAPLTGTSITANDGFVSVHAKAGNIDLTNGNISAKGDVDLRADKGGITITGANATSRAGILSSAGNISINTKDAPRNIGLVVNNVTFSADNNISIDAVAGLAGARIRGADITATKGHINLNGSANWGGFDFSNGEFGGVLLYGDLLFKAGTGTTINATHPEHRKQYAPPTPLVLEGVNLTFDGGAEIHASGSYTGIVLSASDMVSASKSKVFVKNGDVNINAMLDGQAVGGPTGESGSSASGAIVFNNGYGTVSFELDVDKGSNVTINADSSANKSGPFAAFASATPESTAAGSHHNGFVFSGDGNISVSAVSDSADAVNLRLFNNENLTGNLAITGTSETGVGVNFDKYLSTKVSNATITGNSVSGVGVQMTAKNGSADLNSNSVSGSTATGKGGVILSGSNVTITNGTLTGSATDGNGSGVSMVGGSSFILDGATVRGNAVDGSGVSVNGMLTVNNGTQVVGEASGSGDGVAVSGNLTTDAGEGIILNGTASSGDGIKVTGDTVLTGAILKGQADSGNGVNIAGNLTTDSATQVSGHAASGTGVNLGAALTGATVEGDSDTGTGVQLADNAVVTEAVLNGTSASGDGMAVSGSVTLDDTSAAALNASSTSGTGLKLADNANVSIQTIAKVTQVKKDADGNPVLDADGNPETETVTTPVTLTGTSEQGTGIATEGNVSISGVVLNGSTTADTGTGVSLGGNLTIADDISGVTAGATGNGTALVVNNASIHSDGYTDSGKDFVINASVSGNGTAIKTQGSSQLDEVVLNGEATGGGAAVELGGQVSGANITGTSDSGTAVRVTDGANVDGSAVKGHSDSGTGLQVSGNASLSHSGLSGTTQTGTGAAVTGSLTADNSSQVTGSATQDGGAGVTLDGSVTGATVTGDATSGDAVRIADGSQLTGADIKGTSVTGTGIKTQGNVTLEGGTQLAGGSEQGVALDVSGTLNHDPDSSVTTTPDNTGSVIGNENIHEVIPVVPPVPEEGGNSQPDHLPEGGVDEPAVDNPSVPSEPVHGHDHSQSHDASLIRQAEVSSQRRGAVNAQVTQRSQPTRGGFQSAGTPPVPVGGYTPAPQPVDISLCDGNDCQSESLDAGKPAKGKVASSGR